MNWYLVHTKPRQESCALQNLQRQGYPCYLPMLQREKLQRGKLAMVTEPLFPRYLFIQLDTARSGKSWSPIRSTTGVSRLVCFGNEPARVHADLVTVLQHHENQLAMQPEPLFVPGQNVQITDGPFKGIQGVFEMPDGESRVIVLIEMLSKPVRVSVSPGELSVVA